MNNLLFDLNNIRTEISFNSFEELRHILYFYQKNNLCKINIPCKNSLKNEFLLNSIKIAREEFPNIDIIPHFSIFHEFKRNRINTLNSFNEFVQVMKSLSCNEVLLVSGSQKRSTLDSLSTLIFCKENALFNISNFSIGVAFNPYLPSNFFEEEVVRLEKKLQSGLVTSIWIQFGTDITLLESRIKILNNIILSACNGNTNISEINLFGSILIPSKQFLARFKFRPWKGVYCSNEFLDSVDVANNLVKKLFITYESHKICPIIETNILTADKLEDLKCLLKIKNKL